MRSRLVDALRATTVALSTPDAAGTGFCVAPGLVLTCAHVLADHGQQPPEVVRAEWNGAEFDLTVEPKWFRPISKGGPDLALLRLDEIDLPVACLSPMIDPGDDLWTFGYPAGDYRQGDVASFRYDGPSVTGRSELLRASHGRVTGGFSGAPALNWRTGSVCGILRLADSPAGGPPGVRLVGASTVLEVYPELRDPQLWPEGREWLELLDDDQLRAGNWRYPGQRLRAYLRAVQDASRLHPYALALPNAPALTTVYLRQQATRVAAGDEAADDGAAEEDDTVRDTRAVRADLLLGGNPDGALLIGGPGAGKSSLLRYLTATTTTGWLDGSGGQSVPIPIPADALAGDQPAADALADGVAGNLGARLADRNLAELFEREPLPGVPWLVLVDGVDEILDAARRARALETIAFLISERAPYRFLVTSRPLPGGELNVIQRTGRPTRPQNRHRLDAYSIEPFEAAQLPEFAHRWFEALDMPDPLDLVSRFMSQLERSKLTNLAEIPLIATMLCVVFASRSDQLLPHSRADLYEQFISLLLAKRHTQINALGRLQLRVRTYGTAAEQAVDALLAELRPLLERIAVMHFGANGSTSSPGDIAQSLTGHLRPAHVPDGEWRKLLDESLRLSGLLVEQAAELRFLHFTVEEYLAACGAGAEPTGDEIGSLLRRPPTSYWLFRVAILIRQQPDLARSIAETLRDGDMRAVSFFTALVNDGVAVPQDVIASVVGRLVTLAAGSAHLRIGALDQLAILDPARAFDLWQEFASRSDGSEKARIDALAQLIRIDADRARVVLVSVATNAGSGPAIREWVARQLHGWDQDLEHEVLRRISLHEAIDADQRCWAATRLMSQRPAESAGLLAAITGKQDASGYFRRWAALKLCQLDGGSGVSALLAIAADPSVEGLYRLWAAHNLEQFDGQHGAEAFAAVAADSYAKARDRVKAAAELARWDAGRSIAALRTISDDESLESSDRALAAIRLADLDLPAGLAALASLAEDRSGGPGRLQAARAVSWLDQPLAQQLLLTIATDPAADSPERVQAMGDVHDVPAERLADALETLIADGRIDGGDRAELVLRLSGIDPARSVPRLTLLAADAGLTGPDRVRIALELATLDSRLGTQSLALIAADLAIPGRERFVAAVELAALDPSLGAEALVVLSASPTVEGAQRVRAAFELAGLDHQRGVGALASVAGDPATDSGRAQLIRAARLQVLDVRRRGFGSAALREDLDLPAIEATRCMSYRIQAIKLLSGYSRERAIPLAEALTADPDPDVAAQASELVRSLSA